mgnify:CR=1 FL=1|tara:strand:- start:323 stop:724 length:402 start_codon:yes stop_codon:yes gene_type:complete
MPNFPKNTSPAMYKSSGFKMKNSALHKSAKYGLPIQRTFDKVKKAGRVVYDLTMPDRLKIINKKIYDKVTGGKSEGASKAAKKVMLTKEFKKLSPKTKTKTKTNYMLKTPRKDTVKMPVANNNIRPPKKTSKI